jgi:hypothetical protein
MFGSPWTLSRIWILAQWLYFWESSIYIHPRPTTLFSWQIHFHVERVHPLHSKRLNSLSPIVFIPSSWLGIEWSKDSRSLHDSPPQAYVGCWIFILHAYYFWSFAPRRLEVVLELPLGVVSLEKFILPFFVIVSSSRVSWWLLEREKGWERHGSLWTPQREHVILCKSEPQD